jgi:hypothetical protein
VRFGQELAAFGEVFQAKKLVFFEAMHGFDIALICVRCRRDASGSPQPAIISSSLISLERFRFGRGICCDRAISAHSGVDTR